jgi:hypothetical protein
MRVFKTGKTEVLGQAAVRGGDFFVSERARGSQASREPHSSEGGHGETSKWAEKSARAAGHGAAGIGR